MHLRVANSNRISRLTDRNQVTDERSRTSPRMFPQCEHAELMQEREAYASRLGGVGCRTLMRLGVDVGDDEAPMRRSLPLDDSGTTSLVDRKQALPVIGAGASRSIFSETVV